MKDRHALTRQWFSVRRSSGKKADWSTLDIEGVRLMEAARNSRKLRRGAHAGNHFTIVIHDLDGDVENLDELLASIASDGVPNYFGEQRFGHDARNLQLANAFFRGDRMQRDKRSIALSAARAWIFNHVLQQRVDEQTWSDLRPGDIAILDGSNSFFDVDEADDRLKQRCNQLDVHASGPLWGKHESARPIENRIAVQFEDLKSGLEKHTRMSRRALRMAVRNLKWTLRNDTLTVQFYLSRGGFATAVLREIVDYRE